jgi:hypothetical protein
MLVESNDEFDVDGVIRDMLENVSRVLNETTDHRFKTFQGDAMEYTSAEIEKSNVNLAADINYQSSSVDRGRRQVLQIKERPRKVIRYINQTETLLAISQKAASITRVKDKRIGFSSRENYMHWLHSTALSWHDTIMIYLYLSMQMNLSMAVLNSMPVATLDGEMAFYQFSKLMLPRYVILRFDDMNAVCSSIMQSDRQCLWKGRGPKAVLCMYLCV